VVHKKRHLPKAVTWRVLGSLDTFALAWILTGSSKFGLAFSGIEIVTKTLLYYAHERLWYKFKWGVAKVETRSVS